MEKNPPTAEEILLPSSLLRDLDCDEQDKDIQSKEVYHKENIQIPFKFNNNNIQIFPKNINVKLDSKLINNNIQDNFFPNNEMNFENNNLLDELNLNQMDHDNKIIFNNDIIKSNVNNFIFNVKNIRNNKYTEIISLLKTNLNIQSYLHLFDELNYQDYSNLLSFIIKNLSTFTSNSQSFLVIDKILELYKFNLINDNEYIDIKMKLNENIYSFMISYFNKRIPFLIYSNNYIFSIMNLVAVIGYPKNEFVYNEISSDFKKFAFNRLGCILIQKIFPLGNELQQRNLFNIILEQTKELILDKYGHYLFKFLLFQGKNGEKYYFPIFNKIEPELKNYIVNKYSSVVVERLLDSSNEILIKNIVKKICYNENVIVELIYHSYGNYVLQKIIKVTKDNDILGMIYRAIMKNKNSLYKLAYGKKLIKEILTAYTLK